MILKRTRRGINNDEGVVAITDKVRNECGMFVMYCMQCCMSMSAFL